MVRGGGGGGGMGLGTGGKGGGGHRGDARPKAGAKSGAGKAWAQRRGRKAWARRRQGTVCVRAERALTKRWREEGRLGGGSSAVATYLNPLVDHKGAPQPRPNSPMHDRPLRGTGIVEAHGTLS